MEFFLGAHCLVGGKRILINRCELLNFVGKQTQWKYCDLRSHHVCYGNMEKEHWVWIFGIVWDSSLKVLVQGKAILIPDYNQESARRWKCRIRSSTEGQDKERELLRQMEGKSPFGNGCS